MTGLAGLFDHKESHSVPRGDFRRNIHEWGVAFVCVSEGYNGFMLELIRETTATLRIGSHGTQMRERLLTEVLLENIKDVLSAENGAISPGQNRRSIVTDALVDTGATMLSLPTSLIEKLGLNKYSTRRVRSATGVAEANLYAAVRLTIQDRFCTMDVMEVPDGTPVLIGQLPLEQLDFVVDLQSRALIGNPAHGGEQMYELY
jgi:predicted aspartyl protease